MFRGESPFVSDELGRELFEAQDKLKSRLPKDTIPKSGLLCSHDNLAVLPYSESLGTSGTSSLARDFSSRRIVSEGKPAARRVR